VSNENDDRTTDCIANLEPVISDAPLAAEETPRFNTPVRVHFHSIRKRLADVDGISGKAALDGIVIAGILRDDSPGFVEQVTYSQEKGSEEKTIITIETSNN